MAFESPEEIKALSQEQIDSLSYVLNLVNCPEEAVIEACNSDEDFMQSVSDVMKSEIPDKEKGERIDNLYDDHLDQAA